MSDPAPHILTTYADRVEAELRRRLAAGRFPPPLGEAIAHSVFAAGKRLRPALVMAACEVCGGAADDALPAAAAVEMIHTYSLIHDDLPSMDNDDFRRGKPACHRAYGEAIAILAGDALQNEAFGVLAEAYPAPLAAELVRMLAAACGGAGMVGGQVLDITARPGEINLELLRRMHAAKTGALIAASCAMGARVGGAGEREVDVLSEYGRRLGMAFQITDDILDATAASSQLGKTAGKDAAAGKLTFPAALGLAASREAAEREIAAALAALELLGAAGEPLAELARYVLRRTR